MWRGVGACDEDGINDNNNGNWKDHDSDDKEDGDDDESNGLHAGRWGNEYLDDDDDSCDDDDNNDEGKDDDDSNGLGPQAQAGEEVSERVR